MDDLNTGATNEIVSRWPEYKQRNCAINPSMYGAEYCGNMAAGIQIVRDRHDELKSAGVDVWSIAPELSNLLDQLAGIVPAP